MRCRVQDSYGENWDGVVLKDGRTRLSVCCEVPIAYTIISACNMVWSGTKHSSEKSVKARQIDQTGDKA